MHRSTTAGFRADDALRGLRGALSTSEPSYDGEYYSFGGLVIDPCAVQAHVPIWVGGRTLRSLRRAVDLADGWCPFATSPVQAREWLDRMEVPDGFEVVLPPRRPLDPLGEPDQAIVALAELAEAGATSARVSFVHDPLAHYLEQLEALTVLHNQT